MGAAQGKWPLMRLGEVCEVRAGADYKAVLDDNGQYPIYGTGGIMGRASQCRCPANSVIVGRKGTLDNPLLINEPFWNIDTCFGLIPDERLDAKYLWRFCQNFDFYSLCPSSGRPSTTSDAIRDISIPLPPLSVQREIVARLDAALSRAGQLEKDFADLAAQADVEFKAALNEEFAGGTSETGHDCPLVRLGDVCETTSGGTPSKDKSEYYDGGTIPWLRSGEVCRKDICQTEMTITESGLQNSSAKYVPKDSIVVAMYGATAGQVGILRIRATTNQAICVILPSSTYLPEFLYYQLLSMKDAMVAQAQGGAQPNISQIKIKNLEIALPPLSVQRAIVSRLDAARKRADGIVALARQASEAAANLKKALLKEAFE